MARRSARGHRTQPSNARTGTRGPSFVAGSTEQEVLRREAVLRRRHRPHGGLLSGRQHTAAGRLAPVHSRVRVDLGSGGRALQGAILCVASGVFDVGGVPPRVPANGVEVVQGEEKQDESATDKSILGSCVEKNVVTLEHKRVQNSEGVVLSDGANIAFLCQPDWTTYSTYNSPRV